MKNLLFAISILISSTSLFAQNTDTVCVVFTSTKSETSGFRNHLNPNYNKSLYRCQTHFYTIFDRGKKYSFYFQYRNWNDKPDKPIISKPVSFLETVEYIDWDVIGPTLTKEQAEAKYREIISHSKIYFIDRNEIENGTLKMVPVEVYKSRIK